MEGKTYIYTDTLMVIAVLVGSKKDRNMAIKRTYYGMGISETINGLWNAERAKVIKL